MNRVTPEYITELAEDEIFVFGSNEGGRHGAGAARTAFKKFGAIMGQPEGLAGQSYALPTVNEDITDKLPLPKIAEYVQRMIDIAKVKPHLKFLVTEVGCGLAGWTVEKIAPLFKNAKSVENIYLPASFLRILK